ncbi:1,4-alpha-glucan branching protein GlgB [candidate division KSB1 bacterium]|nr:MAG: 1,4-alpha-glucan branching protein GlgB [candidate division KSB1 bacterium]MBC6949841.1 1,4-alpha-glucan branching protein GlgB [candidate division KSB1 bacterium]MCE7944381.1 1,4-alpha-glucan branching protein GlgB [Chlorobi bacterium CHB1]MDL1876999.1 1,4-alpha-glucan branching protein GlgB [Cytophagia bacterium CHB2]
MHQTHSADPKQPATVSHKDFDRIVHGDHHDPFSILGIHKVALAQGNGIVIRVFAPEADRVNVIMPDEAGAATPMHKTNGMGFFVATFPEHTERFRYQLEIINQYGQSRRIYDPYAFLPVLTDFDLHLFAEGTHWSIYEKLGAHPLTIDDVKGVHFAVWAPSARRVSVIGNFNNWDGRRHPMRVHLSGVWEIFIPGLSAGEVYKFEIKTREGHLRVKSDPFAFATELRPSNASIVHERKAFQWQDQSWMENRKATSWLDRPMSIYEIHLGSWRRKSEEENGWYSYREIAAPLADYLTTMGYTHIEVMPLMEYPYDPSWGYQVTGYFAVTRRYGSPDDFAYFVDYMHRHNIGVIMDWVPAHFPKDDWALRWFDGTALFEHLDPRLGEHPDWGTLIFNYGRNEVRNFLIASALFWLEEYHIDGLRVDAVASMLYLDYSRNEGQWLPNKYGGRENLEAIAFIKKLNEIVHEKFPGAMMIAEESTAWPMVSRPTYLGGLGFTFKWNMGWMTDFLRYMKEDPIHRKYHQNLITFSMYYAFSENFILPLSHDEVVHGKRSLLDKMPGDTWQKMANFRVALGYMYGHPGKKLTFMGSEFGQWWEWNHADSLQWHLLEQEQHRQLQQYVKDLNALYRHEPALYEIDYSWEGFQWIDFQDFDASIISFIRYGKNTDEALIFACNFTPVPRPQYRIGVPFLTSYEEILNSDSQHYGGSNMGNAGKVFAEEKPHHNQDYSMQITFPPLAVLVFKGKKQTTA